jgi:hypothetical protein
MDYMRGGVVVEIAESNKLGGYVCAATKDEQESWVQYLRDSISSSNSNTHPSVPIKKAFC